MTQYDAADIEVLDGLDPVRKRPGMYTDVSCPNHLAQEVIDNSVDEALAGFANHIEVRLYEDGSVGVTDNGRGMPVDIHPEQGVPGVELILTRLHAGAKFSNKNYRYSGGLHGVGISVVNALSTTLNVVVKRNSQCYEMAFASGDKTTDLSVIGTVARKDTGTQVRFWPDPKYFDSVKIVTSATQAVVARKSCLVTWVDCQLSR
jgi:topoisomerase-4 subunit B